MIKQGTGPGLPNLGMPKSLDKELKKTAVEFNDLNSFLLFYSSKWIIDQENIVSSTFWSSLETFRLEATIQSYQWYWPISLF